MFLLLIGHIKIWTNTRPGLLVKNLTKKGKKLPCKFKFIELLIPCTNLFVYANSFFCFKGLVRIIMIANPLTPRSNF